MAIRYDDTTLGALPDRIILIRLPEDVLRKMAREQYERSKETPCAGADGGEK